MPNFTPLIIVTNDRRIAEDAARARGLKPGSYRIATHVHDLLGYWPGTRHLLVVSAAETAKPIASEVTDVLACRGFELIDWDAAVALAHARPAPAVDKRDECGCHKGCVMTPHVCEKPCRWPHCLTEAEHVEPGHRSCSGQE